MSVHLPNAILRWYDANARELPWRARGEALPDPYRVWLSEVMLQQTTVAMARPYFEKFTGRWPTVAALAEAAEAEVMAAWAGLGYYARARNLVACARAVADEHGGRFPDTEAELFKLTGIGRYTAAAIAAIAFGRRAVVVDANVERVVSRLFAVEETLPEARGELYRLTDGITPDHRSGDFAQAMMDLGATICTARNPACGICPAFEPCEARRGGEPARYPLKRAKAARPLKETIAYWLEHDGHVLLVRRPGKGMLGGMMALPTGPWAARVADAGEGAPAEAAWQEAGAVDHVFTHFALTARLLCARVEERVEGTWWPTDRIGEAGLPTLFAKLAARGAAWQRDA